MEIRSAIFEVSNSNPRQCPDSTLPEYAFIGRSNVGKSSLINMLTGVKGLAKTSSQPGKTQLINHFIINNNWYLVDLPGYGYAKTSKTERERWGRMIRSYIIGRKQLCCVFVLLDSRIAPQRIDIDFINFLGNNGIPMAMVFTKSDKENQRTVMRNVAAMKKELLQTWEELPEIIITSSATGHGRENLLNYIQSINDTL